MLLARLGTPAPIHYVQDAISNLCHPYIGVTTMTINKQPAKKYCNSSVDDNIIVATTDNNSVL